MEDISIHALLAESDKLAHRWAAWYCLFLSTLSLRRATIFAVRPYDAPIFLSTLSLRRATAYGRINDISRLIFLSTLSLRRATGALKHVHQTEEISIHALLAESDLMPIGTMLASI